MDALYCTLGSFRRSRQCSLKVYVAYVAACHVDTVTRSPSSSGASGRCSPASSPLVDVTSILSLRCPLSFPAYASVFQCEEDWRLDGSEGWYELSRPKLGSVSLFKSYIRLLASRNCDCRLGDLHWGVGAGFPSFRLPSIGIGSLALQLSY